MFVELLTIAALVTQAPEPSGPSFERVFQGLADARVDPAAGAEVADLALMRESFQLVMHSGQLSLLEPVDGRVLGAVFTGSAELRVAPPLQVERDHLFRVLEELRPGGAGVASSPVEAVALFFTDGTVDELRSKAAFGPLDPDGDADDVLDEARDFVLDEGKRQIDPGLMTAVLNPSAPPFFHAHFRRPRGAPLFFRIDEAEAEEVAFGVEARDVDGDQYETLSQFHAREEYATGEALAEEPRRLASLDHYELEVDLGGGLDFEAHARVTLVPETSGGEWIPLQLAEDLEVDSIRYDGADMAYVRPEDSSTLWVQLPPETSIGDPSTLELWYEGDFLERVEGWTSLKASTGWYPRHARQKATFDVTFETPDNRVFTGSGRLASRSEDDGRVTSRWVVEEPATHASFNIGEFEETEIDEADIPGITLQFAEKAHAVLRDDLFRVSGFDMVQQRNMGQRVGFDIATSVRFFQNTFGPLPYDALYVTEIPASHGQAFPGMIHLSWTTFQWTGRQGYDQIFRAHEVAHQWWGLAVDYRTYHDVWLSEGLAEFSGLWYMGASQMSSPLYRSRLGDYRDAIIERREDAGPIWLGPRAVTTQREGTIADYQTIVYEKGAWIFHMLRNLMLDLDTMEEDRFRAMLSELYETYRGSSVSTQDFQSLVEQHFGQDMSWFFRQWVYGTDIPKYRFSHTGEDTVDGHVVTVRVVQENVADDFQMYVPIYLGFGDDGWARLRILVDGPVTEVELPTMPRAPDSIQFNDLEAVLAEVEVEAWQEP